MTRKENLQKILTEKKKSLGESRSSWGVCPSHIVCGDECRLALLEVTNWSNYTSFLKQSFITESCSKLSAHSITFKFSSKSLYPAIFWMFGNMVRCLQKIVCSAVSWKMWSQQVRCRLAVHSTRKEQRELKFWQVIFWHHSFRDLIWQKWAYTCSSTYIQVGMCRSSGNPRIHCQDF